MYKTYALWALLVLSMLTACVGHGPGRGEPDAARSFQLKDLAKSDVDLVAEMHFRLLLGYLRELTEKIYRRNPIHWRRAGHASIEDAVGLIFSPHRPNTFQQLRHRRSIDALYLAFDPDFPGDRVLALIEGLRTMLLDAYGGKQEFFLTDELDVQKLYLAARNLEIAVWKLSNDRDATGTLFLLTNEANGDVANLSFERLFGKMIGLQDAIAGIVADSTNRRIKSVIQNVATAVFFPI